MKDRDTFLFLGMMFISGWELLVNHTSFYIPLLYFTIALIGLIDKWGNWHRSKKKMLN